MGENLKLDCAENPGDDFCKWELTQLKLELGPIALSEEGVSVGGVPGTFGVKKRGVKYSLSFGNSTEALSKSQRNAQEQFKAQQAARDAAAKHTEKPKPIMPDDWREIHGKDYFTGEAV